MIQKDFSTLVKNSAGDALIAKRGHYAEAGIVFLLLLTSYASDILQVPFHPDESSWIGSSNVFEEYLRLRFNSEAWDPEGWNTGTRNGEAIVTILANST